MFSDPIKNIAAFGISHGMRVVDIGAGAGYYSIEAAKLVGDGGRVYAIDVQADLLEKVRHNAEAAHVHNIEVIRANAEILGGTKLKDALVDRVIVSNVFFQIDQAHRDTFVLEIKRILKSAGKALLVDWEPGGPLTPHGALPKILAEGFFTKNGFTVEREFDAGDHHYGIIFKKS